MNFIDKIFREKEFLNFDDYKQVNTDYSSEMLYGVIHFFIIAFINIS